MSRLGLDDYFSQAPRVRLELSYESPLFFRQEASTVLRVEQVGSSSLTLSFEVWGEEFEGRPRHRVAAGRYVTVQVPGGVGGNRGTIERPRSRPWPEGWFTSRADRELTR